jgi:hypothetical protein
VFVRTQAEHPLRRHQADVAFDVAAPEKIEKRSTRAGRFHSLLTN